MESMSVFSLTLHKGLHAQVSGTTRVSTRLLSTTNVQQELLRSEGELTYPWGWMRLQPFKLGDLGHLELSINSLILSWSGV